MGFVLTELKKLKASQVYFDANIFICALEGISPLQKSLKTFLKASITQK